MDKKEIIIAMDKSLVDGMYEVCKKSHININQAFSILSTHAINRILKEEGAKYVNSAK